MPSFLSGLKFLLLELFIEEKHVRSWFLGLCSYSSKLLPLNLGPTTGKGLVVSPNRFVCINLTIVGYLKDIWAAFSARVVLLKELGPFLLILMVVSLILQTSLLEIKFFSSDKCLSLLSGDFYWSSSSSELESPSSSPTFSSYLLV